MAPRCRVWLHLQCFAGPWRDVITSQPMSQQQQRQQHTNQQASRGLDAASVPQGGGSSSRRHQRHEVINLAGVFCVLHLMDTACDNCTQLRMIDSDF